MWGERGEGSAGEFVCMGRKMLLPGRSMPYAPVYSGFSYLLWTGSSPSLPGTPNMSWHQGLGSSVLSVIRVSLSSEHHPSFPILPFLYWLSFLLEALSLTAPHTIPVPLGLLPLVPSSCTTL